MSKIQEALQRIQSEGGKGPFGGRTTRSGDPVVASIVLERDEFGPDDESAIRKIVVELNKTALRESGLIVPEDNDTQLEDQYREIKRPLIANAFGKRVAQVDNGRAIMVTSALPGEGKTFTSLNLAISMSVERDHSVLLVDADVARPHISDVLGIAEMPGLLDLVEDGQTHPEDYTLPTSIAGLSVLPAGKPRLNATELLSDRHMETLVRAMVDKDPNRLIVFDTPPLLPTTESKVLVELGGQVVFVVRANSTPQGAVAESLRILGDQLAVNLVLNQAAVGQFDGYYRYGYSAVDVRENQ
jgi:exopolysaccharide/PEP-CTERM locus tyrosine autokinase